eukprot:11659393-Prorocentrum_lima.AAC.1
MLDGLAAGGASAMGPHIAPGSDARSGTAVARRPSPHSRRAKERKACHRNPPPQTVDRQGNPHVRRQVRMGCGDPQVRRTRALPHQRPPHALAGLR